MAEGGYRYTEGRRLGPFQELRGPFSPSAPIGVSIDEQEDRDLKLQSERATEGLAIVSAIVFLTSAAFVLWAAFAWTTLRFEHGYPSVGVSPGAPGQFLSQRYTSMWWFSYLLVVNYAVTAFLALAVATPGRITGIFLHYLSSLLAGGINFFSGIVLLVLYWWYCNNASATWNAASNDIRWCCVHGNASPLAAELCGAIDPMTCAPMVTRTVLAIDDAYFWMIVGAWIAFALAFVHLILNGKLLAWRVWTAPRIK